MFGILERFVRIGATLNPQPFHRGSRQEPGGPGGLGDAVARHPAAEAESCNGPESRVSLRGCEAAKDTSLMSLSPSPRRRPSVHITLHRAARFHRLVTFLAQSPRSRPDILSHLKVGLRTFYRELDFLKRCGVKVRHRAKLYHLAATAEEAEGRLPFPDPQLSFAEMVELARCDSAAGRRMAELLASVVRPEPTPKKPRGGGRKRKAT